MTEIPLTDEEREAVDALISWALEEHSSALEPNWLDDKLDYDGLTTHLQNAYGKLTQGVTQEDVDEVDSIIAAVNSYASEDGTIHADPATLVRELTIAGWKFTKGEPVQPGIAHRADVTMRLARAFDISTSAFADPASDAPIGSEKAMVVVFSIVHGIVNEYLDDGDQMVEACCLCQVSPGGHRILNPVCPEHGVNS